MNKQDEQIMWQGRKDRLAKELRLVGSSVSESRLPSIWEGLMALHGAACRLDAEAIGAFGGLTVAEALDVVGRAEDLRQDFVKSKTPKSYC